VDRRNFLGGTLTALVGSVATVALAKTSQVSESGLWVPGKPVVVSPVPSLPPSLDPELIGHVVWVNGRPLGVLTQVEVSRWGVDETQLHDFNRVEGPGTTDLVLNVQAQGLWKGGSW
jgi:hypothetical protein